MSYLGREEVLRIKQEHAELVEALGKMIEMAYSDDPVSCPEDMDAINNARAILRRAKP